jgi:hypothetical protein
MLRAVLRVVFVFVAGSVSLVACEKPASDDGFGEARPVKDDGMIGRPAIVEQPVNWEGALKIVPTFDASTSTLAVTVALRPGFHAYGPGEEVSKPIALSVDGTNGWVIDGAVQIPAGTKKNLGELGTSVILEGVVPLTAKLKGGSGNVSGTVEVQVCTEKACDRPRKHPFQLPASG